MKETVVQGWNGIATALGGIAVGAIDGPLPFADLVVAGAVAIAGYQAISKSKDEVKINIGIKKKDNKDTVIYRYGGTNPGNLTPKWKDEDSGLSFSTIPPRPGGSAAVTTINALNETGVVYAYQDKKTHVTVVPAANIPVEAWIKAGSGSVWTKAVKSVVVKWDGGN